MSRQPSDLELAASVADVVAVPRVPSADSFVLHAPLELMARFALLPRVSPDRREEVRARIAGIGEAYAAFGPGVPSPPPLAFDDTVDAVTALLAAIAEGDADRADGVASWIGSHVEPHELGPLLGDALVPLLGAAGHSPIFLAGWPRVAPRRELTGGLLRPLVRRLCERPDWRVSWPDRTTVPTADHGSLFDVLAATPHLGPTEPYIHPLMSRIDHDGTAARLAGSTLGARDVHRAAVDLLRAAAWSMVLERSEAAPYLWSHCLTMPLAIVQLLHLARDPRRMLAVAATYVTGFRAAVASVPLEPRTPSPAGLPLELALEEGQDTAVAAAGHEAGSDRAGVVRAVVDRAAPHHDAHLVKYVLACLDAASIDPDGDRLYLAAAALLTAWWAEADRVSR
jgi:hypothetical protein